MCAAALAQPTLVSRNTNLRTVCKPADLVVVVSVLQVLLHFFLFVLLHAVVLTVLTGTFTYLVYIA